MLDPFEWLQKQTLYPKILIEDQAAVGCAEIYTQAIASEKRLWGGVEFDGPWKAFWLPQIDLIDGKEVHHAKKAVLPKPPVMDRGANISEEQWTKQVELCLEKIEAKELSKVVLARKVIVDPVLPKKLNFWFEPAPGIVWLGNTPEKLFWREGPTLYSDVLAGTHTCKNKLMLSEKDAREFEWVKRDLERKFRLLCTQSKTGKIRVKPAGNLWHLHAIITGKLKNNISDGAILKALHPTPAMGGVPWKNARRVISELENFKRGLYAAPLGFYSKKRAKFIVCIRSALLVKNKMHLFSGTGIVKGSDPKTEWDELNRKVELWTQVS